jgi:hypothetical protein
VRRLVGGDHHERVVGGGVAVDVTRLNEPSASSRASCCITEGSRSIGGQKAQHGGHVGADHAGALADAGDGHGGTADLHLGAEGLGQGVGGHDAFGRARPVVRLRVGNGGGQPASMRSTGSGSMITPVEKGRTCSGATLSWRASAMQVARARAKPSAPVPALALPVLMTMARMAWPLPDARG